MNKAVHYSLLWSGYRNLKLAPFRGSFFQLRRSWIIRSHFASRNNKYFSQHGNLGNTGEYKILKSAFESFLFFGDRKFFFNLYAYTTFVSPKLIYKKCCGDIIIFLRTIFQYAAQNKKSCKRRNWRQYSYISKPKYLEKFSMKVSCQLLETFQETFEYFVEASHEQFRENEKKVTWKVIVKLTWKFHTIFV